MLIEFRVQNHRSLLAEQVLTMEAATIGAPDDPRPREVSGHRKALLPAAALYGANASGKSNLLAAFAFMREAVAYSHRTWEPDGGVPRDPFAWDPEAPSPSLFEATLLIDGVRYQYGFVANDRQFLEEWLFAWPRGKKQTWFERDGQSFKFGEQLKGENRVIEQVTRTNALFLSAAAQNKHEQLGVVHRWFQRSHLHGQRYWSFLWGRHDAFFRTRWLDSALGLSAGAGQLGLSDEDDDDAHADADARATMLRELLRAADTGIVDVRASRTESTRRRPRTRIEFRHRGADPDSGWLDLQQESHGTITIFELAPYVLDALHRGSVVFVDELESSLHPLLARQLVDLFNSPKTNPHGAQLIFATHNTSLVGRVMGEPLLRRDQIWLTEKNPKGETCIYPLTDYKPRKAENLERGYLQGRYGAIPLLGELVQEVSEEDPAG